MDKSFPFLLLPLLVKLKILRQYLPALFKSRRMVNGMSPEMSNLLECRSSWLDPLDDFHRLVLLVSDLREGCYLSRNEDCWSDGFRVEIDDEKNVLRFVHFNLVKSRFPETGLLVCAKPVLTLVDFLEEFAERFRPSGRVAFCHHPSFGPFFIDSDSVRWSDGKFYDVRSRIPLDDDGAFVRLDANELTVVRRRGSKMVTARSESFLKTDLDLSDVGRDEFASAFLLEFELLEESGAVMVTAEKDYGVVERLLPGWMI